MRIIFEMDPTEEKEEPTKVPQSNGPRDVWDFEGLRKTLWGEGLGLGTPRDVWDLPGIRKTLWGR